MRIKHNIVHQPASNDIESILSVHRIGFLLIRLHECVAVAGRQRFRVQIFQLCFVRDPHLSHRSNLQQISSYFRVQMYISVRFHVKYLR